MTIARIIWALVGILVLFVTLAMIFIPTGSAWLGDPATTSALQECAASNVEPCLCSRRITRQLEPFQSSLIEQSSSGATALRLAPPSLF
jgi:hypothetical protein